MIWPYQQGLPSLNKMRVKAMKIFGKSLSEYISFAKVFLIFIAVVGLLRLGLSLGGVQDSTAKWSSITAVELIGLIYFSVRVYTSGFGAYKQLLIVLFIQSLVAQVTISIGIATAMVTNNDNVFSRPEFSGPFLNNGKSLAHIGGHFLFGGIVFTIVFWLVGSLIMFVTSKVTAAPKGRSSVASA